MNGTTRNSGAADVVRMPPPPLHEGVGNALRQTFVPRFPSIPQDMMALLSQLN